MSKKLLSALLIVAIGFSVAYCSKKKNRLTVGQASGGTSPTGTPGGSSSGPAQTTIANQSTEEYGYTRNLVVNNVSIGGGFADYLFQELSKEAHYGQRGGSDAYNALLANICVQGIQYALPGENSSVSYVYGIEIHNTACPNGITKLDTKVIWLAETYVSSSDGGDIYNLSPWIGNSAASIAVGQYIYYPSSQTAQIEELCTSSFFRRCEFSFGEDDKSIVDFKISMPHR